MQELFRQDPARAKKYSLELELGLFLDYSKNLLNQADFAKLFSLAEEKNLKAAIHALFQGKKINFTEDQRVFHVALRNTALADSETCALLEKMFGEMKAVCEKIHARSEITDIVHVGIGGSDLGPRFICDAFQERRIRKVHFISNGDPLDAERVLSVVDPHHTFTISVSKSFTTQETLQNNALIQAWYETAAVNWQKNMIAVTAVPENTPSFEQVLIFPKWVNGRFSLFSAVGVTIALALGWEFFLALKRGAAEMDDHFFHADFPRNMPVILALLEIANEAPTFGVMPYAQALKMLPAYLQQLVMESNGKQVGQEGERLSEMTSRIVWGDVGTNNQHSFFQLLHQGSHEVPVDFIGIEGSAPSLLANMLSQAQVLMMGRTEAEAYEELLAAGKSPELARALAPHLVILGNHASNILLLRGLTPSCVGALIALYEHKVYAQSVIWGINAFDQFGVELGKKMARKNLALLQGAAGMADDPSTQQLIARLNHKSSLPPPGEF